MRILAFESSAKAASVALLEESRLVGETYLNCGLTHSRTLMQMAETLLSVCGVAPEAVSAVACAAGPGSFTGIRIGMAAAKGFAWGRELPCVGVSTLAAMAQQARMFEGVICCAMDARRAEVYHARFLCQGGKLTRLCEDCAISLETLASALAEDARPKLFVGDGAALCQQALAERVPDCRLAPEQLMMQRASGVALLAREQLLQEENCSAASLQPNYLRLSQAERERREREH